MGHESTQAGDFDCCYSDQNILFYICTLCLCVELEYYVMKLARYVTIQLFKIGFILGS